MAPLVSTAAGSSSGCEAEIWKPVEAEHGRCRHQREAARWRARGGREDGDARLNQLKAGAQFALGADPAFMAFDQSGTGHPATGPTTVPQRASIANGTEPRARRSRSFCFCSLAGLKGLKKEEKTRAVRGLWKPGGKTFGSPVIFKRFFSFVDWNEKEP